MIESYDRICVNVDGAAFGAEIGNIVKASGAGSQEEVIHDFMSEAISDAWMRAKSMQTRYKGG